VSHLPDVSADLAPADAARLEAMLHRRARTGSAVYGRLMAHPGLTERIQSLGGYLRYEGVLPDALRETLILAAARQAGSAYEWVMHEPIARAAGVSDPLIAALRAGRAPEGADRVTAAALRIAGAVGRREAVDQGDHDAVAAALGAAGVIEVVYLVAFYGMFAAGLIAFEVPLPDGVADPFA
jgi:4-carboxymuconolactone decarboxylase